MAFKTICFASFITAWVLLVEFTGLTLHYHMQADVKKLPLPVFIVNIKSKSCDI